MDIVKPVQGEFAESLRPVVPRHQNLDEDGPAPEDPGYQDHSQPNDIRRVLGCRGKEGSDGSEGSEAKEGCDTKSSFTARLYDKLGLRQDTALGGGLTL
jgi:hypothetical protein